MLDAYTGFIRCGLQKLTTPDEGLITVGTSSSLRMDRWGQVSGLAHYLETLHRGLKRMLIEEWDVMHRRGAISSAITQERIAIEDVLHFVALLPRLHVSHI